MYAVIRTGGKQYRVAKDDVIRVERLSGEAGDSVTLDQVLMVGGNGTTEIGVPVIEDAAVTATVIEQARARKILVFKKKRRQNYRRKQGHRQDLTVLRITDILPTGGKAAAAKTAAQKPAVKAAATDKPAAKPKAAKSKAVPAKKVPAKKAAPKKAAAKKPATKAKSPAKKSAKKPTE